MVGKINKIIFVFVFYIVHKYMIYGFVSVIYFILFIIYYHINLILIQLD